MSEITPDVVQKLLHGTRFARLQVISELGSGGFADVFKIPMLYWYIFHSVRFEINDRQNFNREMNTLKKCKLEGKPGSEYVVGIIDADIAPPVILLEHIEGYSIHKMILEGSYKWVFVRQVAFQLAHALQSVHDSGIIHRDLKSNNVMIDKQRNYRVVLIDFGISRELRDEMTRNKGTPGWVAPEVMLSGKYSAAADIYSYSMVLYELCTRMLPYEDHPKVNKPMDLRADIAYGGLRPTLPPFVPPGFRRIMLACWQADPALRPTLHQIRSELALDNFLTAEEAGADVPRPIHRTNVGRAPAQAPALAPAPTAQCAASAAAAAGADYMQQ